MHHRTSAERRETQNAVRGFGVRAHLACETEARRRDRAIAAYERQRAWEQAQRAAVRKRNDALSALSAADETEAPHDI